MKGFYSPIDQLAAQLPRTKGTGAEFMTELSKRPGYKPQEAQDRELQTLMALPKMERAKFLEALKSKPAPQLEESTLAKSILKNRGLNVLPDEPTKYGEYTHPGGSNYREILLRMPHDEQRKKDPSSGHWDQPNVLAHVRAKDRIGPNGEKVLHIEEIQSDWHQQGRESGYQSKDMPKQLAAAQLAHRRLKQKLEEAKLNSVNVDKKLSSGMPLYQDPEVRQRMEAVKIGHNNDIMDLMPQVMKAEAARQEIEQKAKTGVPDAPFKKNWHELALKKMIHHAAANGYDSIAITPGREQADRYKLSRQVGTVAYHPEEQHFQAFAPNRETIINEKGATPERVSELIGKDVAKRLMQAPQTMGHHTLEGEDLNVGGEGMKGFYDKMIPSFLNQFGKKYGAQVGKIQVPVKHELQGLRTMGGYKDEPPLDLHHFPITPQMREDVTQNGVPLYSEGGEVKDLQDTARQGDAYQDIEKYLQTKDAMPDVQISSNLPEGTNGMFSSFNLPIGSGQLKINKNSPKQILPSVLTHEMAHAADRQMMQQAMEQSMFGKSNQFTEAYEKLVGSGVRNRTELARKLNPKWVSKNQFYRAIPQEIAAHGISAFAGPNIQDSAPTHVNATAATEFRILLDLAQRNADKGPQGLAKIPAFFSKIGKYAKGGEVEVRPTVKDETIQRKIPEIEAAAKALQAGAINRKEYDKVVHTHKPVKPYTFVPQPASDEDADRALMANKKPHWRGHEQWPAGRKVGLRLDIPAYETHGVWVNSIHDEEGKGEDKRKTSYGPVSSVKNATFDAGPSKAIKVATGEDNKSPFARIHGELHHMTEDEAVEHIKAHLNHPDYAQVGMDPRRHGFFYDRKTMKPVAHSEHVVQIGPLVLAHKPTYGKRESYATGGKVKPIGYTKEKVTVSPNLDQMHYELINVKRFKKAK